MDEGITRDGYGQKWMDMDEKGGMTGKRQPDLGQYW